MADPTSIGELLQRDLSRPIEEIVQVDETDEATVHEELSEYVATASIQKQYRKVLKAIADAPSEPSKAIGVWVSGFFGSGKSSFAKNLGYALRNPSVNGRPAAEMFKEAVSDSEVSGYVDLINARLKTDVVMFDVTKASEVRRSDEKIAEVVYRSLLKDLGYAPDYDVAELEIDLESEGRLEAFVALSEDVNGREWSKARKGAQKLNYASAILHRMEPGVYPSADSWAKSQGGSTLALTVDLVAQRVFELFARRRPGHAVVFIVDEVGQYVARSAGKIEDLRALVEALGRESVERVKAGTAPAPAWFVVTSQERLDEVVAAIDSKTVILAKLQDRFKYEVDMSPEDINQIATQRVLAKTEAADPILRDLYRRHEGQLKDALRLERSTIDSAVAEDDFVGFYPYPPHFIDVCIDVVSGIRLQPGAPRHLGGSNRTIIKQAYEMLASPQTALAKAPIGTLVTMDKVYDLVEGNLRTEKRSDIAKIADAYGAGSVAHHVAKTIALLEFVRQVPRTDANIASFLVGAVGDPKPSAEVKDALELLYEGQFVRESEDGWKLQTDQEKTWDSERRGHLDPRPRDRNEILRAAVAALFRRPALQNYRLNQKTFGVGVALDGVTVGKDGQVPLQLVSADDTSVLQAKVDAVRHDSRMPAHANAPYWVFALTTDVDKVVADVYASRQMVVIYDQMRAQNKISAEESALLQSEKSKAAGHERRLQDKLEETLRAGHPVFRGVVTDASSYGPTLDQAVKGFLDESVPKLYAKLEMGVRKMKGDEPEKLLAAVTLSGLPPVFYDGDDGLDLVTKDQGKYVMNPSAEIAQEMLRYLNQQHEYGTKVTGKSIETVFEGVGYGWDREVYYTVLAALLRAGAIEVGYQGRRFRNHSDPQAKVPFANTVAFRSASFAPRDSIDLKTLITAVQRFEELTGEEVDVEEGAIAEGFKRFAEAEIRALLPVSAEVAAHRIPVGSLLSDYKATLDEALGAQSDDCVRMLAGEGRTIAEARERVGTVHALMREGGATTVEAARRAVREMAPQLSAPDVREAAAELEELLGSDAFLNHIARVTELAGTVRTAYVQAYQDLHGRRAAAYSETIASIEGQPDWLELAAELPEESLSAILSPLRSRACSELDLTDATRCPTCHATIQQMESDLAALDGLYGAALGRVQELLAPEDEGVRVEHVRVREVLGGTLDSAAAVEESVERLKAHLLKLVSTGARIVIT